MRAPGPRPPRHGKVNLLFSNAGAIGPPSVLADAASWGKIVDLVRHTALAVVPQLRRMRRMLRLETIARQAVSMKSCVVYRVY